MASSETDDAIPSSPACAADRVRATQSLSPETVNDFCNKIGTSGARLSWSARTEAPQPETSRVHGEDNYPQEQ